MSDGAALVTASESAASDANTTTLARDGASSAAQATAEQVIDTNVKKDRASRMMAPVSVHLGHLGACSLPECLRIIRDPRIDQDG